MTVIAARIRNDMGDSPLWSAVRGPRAAWNGRSGVSRGAGDVGEAGVLVAFGVGAVADGGHRAALEANDRDCAPAVAGAGHGGGHQLPHRPLAESQQDAPLRISSGNLRLHLIRGQAGSHPAASRRWRRSAGEAGIPYSEQPHRPQLSPGLLVVVAQCAGLPDFVHRRQLRAAPPARPVAGCGGTAGRSGCDLCGTRRPRGRNQARSTAEVSPVAVGDIARSGDATGKRRPTSQ